MLGNVPGPGHKQMKKIDIALKKSQESKWEER